MTRYRWLSVARNAQSCGGFWCRRSRSCNAQNCTCNSKIAKFLIAQKTYEHDFWAEYWSLATVRTARVTPFSWNSCRQELGEGHGLTLAPENERFCGHPVPYLDAMVSKLTWRFPPVWAPYGLLLTRKLCVSCLKLGLYTSIYFCYRVWEKIWWVRSFKTLEQPLYSQISSVVVSFSVVTECSFNAPNPDAFTSAILVRKQFNLWDILVGIATGRRITWIHHVHAVYGGVTRGGGRELWWDCLVQHFVEQNEEAKLRM